MSVDDYGLEVLKKAAIPLTPGSKAEYLIRTTAGSSTLSAIKESILNAHDMTEVVTTADFGTIKERVTSIAYSAASVGAYTATKVLNYTLIGGKYRYDGSVWSVV